MHRGDSLGLSSKFVHAGQAVDQYGSVVTPIYQTSTFAFASAEQGAERFAGDSDGYIYTRIGNPTVRALEECIAELEEGAGAVATSSGMGAVATAFLALLKSGDHVVSTASVYGPSLVLLKEHLGRFGVASSFVDTSDLEAVRRSLRGETRLIYVETPSNPLLQVTDIRAVADIAHERGALLVVDSTFASPYLQQPLKLDADVVVHSVTKFISGHADVVGGMLVAREAGIARRLRQMMTYAGCCMDAHQAFLVHRGLKTLGLRLDRAQKSAEAVARWLLGRNDVAWVRYLGLPHHPQYDLARKQMSGPGALITFELQGGLAAGRELMNRVRLATLAVSLGGVETLVEHPASMTHSGVPVEERQAAGITDGLVRYAVGIEDANDLIADLEQALAPVAGTVAPYKAQQEDPHISANDTVQTGVTPMRIAVACESLTEVSEHVGRAPLLLVYDVAEDKPKLVDNRRNDVAGHSQQCDGPHEHKPAHQCHDRLVNAVADCQMLVARGMGRRIALDLEARGIKPALIDRDVSPFDAAALAASGKATSQVGYCRCSED